MRPTAAGWLLVVLGCSASPKVRHRPSPWIPARVLEVRDGERDCGDVDGLALTDRGIVTVAGYHSDVHGGAEPEPLRLRLRDLKIGTVERELSLHSARRTEESI